MKKHAVPQNLMDIEFKLLGSMTVRQFTSVAVTFILALLIYFSGLPAVLLYPILFFTVVIGLAMAFLTVNGMPFSTWFNNFVFSIFSSQRKVYHKTGKPPAAFTDKPKTTKLKKLGISKAQPDQDYTAVISRLNKLDEPFENEVVNTVADSKSGVEDILGDSKLTSIDRYFESAVNQNLNKYNLKSAGESLASTTKAPQTSEFINNANEVLVTKTNQVNIRPLDTQAQSEAIVAPRAPGNVQVKSEPEVELKVLDTLQPNQLAGFVCAADNLPLENATVEVIDGNGNLLNSATTDLKGKFVITAALANGSYKLHVKKDGYLFPEFSLELKGELVPMYRYLAEKKL